ncbi:MAG: hypothetical protein LBV23_01565 [Deltaproteobacteria bacterium]|jgi:hypothetical protein|nr:hypothetical protein [Deltaproteobacteria bacterium]
MAANDSNFDRKIWPTNEAPLDESTEYQIDDGLDTEMETIIKRLDEAIAQSSNLEPGRQSPPVPPEARPLERPVEQAARPAQLAKSISAPPPPSSSQLSQRVPPPPLFQSPRPLKPVRAIEAEETILLTDVLSPREEIDEGIIDPNYLPRAKVAQIGKEEQKAGESVPRPSLAPQADGNCLAQLSPMELGEVIEQAVFSALVKFFSR